MMRTPSARALSTISQKASVLVLRTNSRISTSRAPARPMLMRCRLGSMIGLPDMRPSSLRKAMIEPVKVTAPIAAPSDISTRL